MNGSMGECAACRMLCEKGGSSLRGRGAKAALEVNETQHSPLGNERQTVGGKSPMGCSSPLRAQQRNADPIHRDFRLFFAIVVAWHGGRTEVVCIGFSHDATSER